MSAGALAIDAGDLSLGGGLLALLRPALDLVEVGGVVAVRARHRSVRDDLASWCRVEGHEYLGGEDERHLVRRGRFSVPRGAREWGVTLRDRSGTRTSADMLAAVPMPDRADPSSGFAPRGTRIEPGGPVYPFDLNARDHVAPPDIAQLYDSATSSQWTVAEIPWSRVERHPEPLERAIGQIMTFLAENELSALYVPSRFLARIHPAYVETAMFLATQLADEARHIDVFLKRARAGGGGVGISAAVTSHSLHSLLAPDDFLEATFLLSVLGEGTFLDLLAFVRDHAPDECTEEIAKRTRTDEARHVHFGLSHVRHALAHDPSAYARLENAVRRRAATLAGVGGIPAAVQDALVVYAAGGVEPSRIARGHDAFRQLLQTMHDGRVKRLLHAGFTPAQADAISGLHTPNFM